MYSSLNKNGTNKSVKWMYLPIQCISSSSNSPIRSKRLNSELCIFISICYLFIHLKVVILRRNNGTNLSTKTNKLIRKMRIEKSLISYCTKIHTHKIVCELVRSLIIIALCSYSVTHAPCQLIRS